MDYEFFENGSELNNLTEYRVIVTPHNIIYGFICLLGILADLLIISVVLRYIYMRTPTNLYILHWAVFNVLFLIHFIYFYVVKRNFTLFDLYLSYELEAILEVAIIIILLLLTFDCSVEDEVTSQRLPIFVWFFLTMCLIVTHRWHLLETFQICRSCAYVFTVSVVLIKQISCITRKIKYSTNRKIRLTVVSIYVYCWVALWGCYLLTKNLHNRKMLVSALINTCMAVMGSIVNVVLLSYLDEHFKSSFINFLTCRTSRTVDINIQGHEYNDKEESEEEGRRAVFTI